MAISIGINGFGRIGRLAYRASFERDDINVVAINAPDKTPEQLAYIFRYDSVHGRFNGTVEYTENSLIVNGKETKLLDSRDATKLNWGELGADYILECTGKHLTREKAQAHIDAGAKVVIMSAPPKDDTPIFVMGVNHNTYKPEQTIISNASCTTNCLAPIAKVLNDNWGIDEGLMTTIHAATASQELADSFSKRNWRLGRSAVDNIIPTSTGAAKAVGEVIPDLKGRLTGMAFRVPVSDVSVVDLTCTLKKKAKYREIRAAMKAASEGELKGILGYVDEEVVSCDFKTNSHTAIFDEKASIEIRDHFIKIIAWYDNEWAYSNKMLDLALHAKKVREGEI